MYAFLFVVIVAEARVRHAPVPAVRQRERVSDPAVRVQDVAGDSAVADARDRITWNGRDENILSISI